MYSGAGCSELQGRLGSCGPPLIFSFNLNQNWQTAGPRPHHSPCLSVRQVWLEHSRSHVPCNGHFCSTAADSNSQDQRPRMACTSPNIYCLALYRKCLLTPDLKRIWGVIKLTIGQWRWRRVGGMGWGMTTNGYRASFWGEENVSEIDRDDSCTIL